MQIEFLVDAPAFMARLADDLAAARDRAWVQTLSFEGDTAGRALADAMLASPAADRRILIDDYTRYWLSDRFLYSPAGLLDPALRAEARATRAMVADLEAGGVRTRFTSPFGAFFRRIPARDHKKILVVDDAIAYFGGINFSDHNFAWHDMMVRVEHPGVAAFLHDDLRGTWDGYASPPHAAFDGLELISLDGADNEARLERVLAVLRGARERIVVHNAYISFPFTEALGEAAARGVEVTVLTPASNNRGFMRHYMLQEGARAGFRMRLYPDRMSHLKAVLVDDRTLITGSSNFDWLTFTYQPEILAVITQPAAVAAFRAQVLEPDLAASLPVTESFDATIARRAERVLRLASRLGRVVCPARPRPVRD